MGVITAEKGDRHYKRQICEFKMIVFTMGYMPAVILFFYFSFTNANEFPSEWLPNCKKDKNLDECLILSIQRAMETLIPGYPSLGIFPLDPLHFSQLEIRQGSGPVALELLFTNLDALGFKALRFTHVKTDWKEFMFTVTTPKITLKGQYNVKGKVLLLPISGAGPTNIVLKDFVATGKIHFSKKLISGKEHYHIDNVVFNFTNSHVSFKFKNLFSGDETLGEAMSLFLNDNWKLVMQELQPAISKSFGEAVKDVGNRIFSKIPVTSITPP